MSINSEDIRTTGPRLIIDFGNTLTKAAIFDNGKVAALMKVPVLTFHHLEELSSGIAISNAITSSVIDIPEDVVAYLCKQFHHISLDHTTPVPIINLYKTPETLGKDRLSMVVAAASLFPAKNCLVIGAGTCITYDFIDFKGQYHGGSISPGINMRFRALHTFTGKLPLISPLEDVEIIGSTTETSILSGVLIGSVAEIEAIIDKYQWLYDDLQVILSGGDMNYFKERLKNRIFAAENLVLTGLNVILDFNVRKQ